MATRSKAREKASRLDLSIPAIQEGIDRAHERIHKTPKRTGSGFSPIKKKWPKVDLVVSKRYHAARRERDEKAVELQTLKNTLDWYVHNRDKIQADRTRLINERDQANRYRDAWRENFRQSVAKRLRVMAERNTAEERTEVAEKERDSIKAQLAQQRPCVTCKRERDEALTALKVSDEKVITLRRDFAVANEKYDLYRAEIQIAVKAINEAFADVCSERNNAYAAVTELSAFALEVIGRANSHENLDLADSNFRLFATTEQLTRRNKNQAMWLRTARNALVSIRDRSVDHVAREWAKAGLVTP